VVIPFVIVLDCRLPDELVLKILDYLSPTDLLSSARVCRRWLSLTNDKLVIITSAKQTRYDMLGISHPVLLTVSRIAKKDCG